MSVLPWVEPSHIASAQTTCATPTLWNGGVYNDAQGDFVNNVEGLDWSSAGSGMFEGIGPVGTSAPAGTQFTLRYQALLVGLTDASGNGVSFPSLNSDFEYTIIAEVPVMVVNETSIPSIGLQILTLSTLPGGEFYIHHDENINYNISAGLGFDDGNLVVSGTVSPNQVASFTYNGTINSASGSFTFFSPTTFVDPAYISPAEDIAELRLEGTLNYPPLDSDTTTYFASRPGEGEFDEYTVTANDIPLKVDTSSKFYECPPPNNMSIGNQVWLDGNDNGIFDADENPIPGVLMELWTDLDGDGVAEPQGDDAAQVPLTTTTSISGTYAFTSLAPTT